MNIVGFNKPLYLTEHHMARRVDESYLVDQMFCARRPPVPSRKAVVSTLSLTSLSLVSNGYLDGWSAEI